MDSPVASAALCATFLVTIFKASSPAFVTTFNKCFLYFLDKFLPNDKYSYYLVYFLVLGTIE